MLGEIADSCKMETKQNRNSRQLEMETEEIVEPERPEEVLISDQTTSLDDTTFLNKHKNVILICCAVVAAIGNLLIGINAIRPNSLDLNLNPENVIKIVKAVQSENTSQIEEALRKIEQSSNASVITEAAINACKLLATRKIEESIEKWRSIANISEGFSDDLGADTWFITGYLQSEEGMYEEALSAYSKTLDLKPDYVEAYYKRGAVKLSLGRYKGALIDFNEALNLKPDHVEARYGGGSAKLSLGRYKGALTDFSRTLDLKPDHIEALAGLRTAQLHLDANKIIDPNSDSTEEYYKRATAKLSLSQYESAIDDYNKIIQLDPSALSTLNLRV